MQRRAHAQASDRREVFGSKSFSHCEHRRKGTIWARERGTECVTHRFEDVAAVLGYCRA
jgi:hypothetical protein